MSEFGLKIKNIEAATLYEYNKGLRDHYEYKEAMFVNSLFKDFLYDHGLNIWNNESTRDLICLEFNFGTRNYEKEIKHIKKIAKQTRTDCKKSKSLNSKKLMAINKNKRKKIEELYKFANEHKEEYEELTADQIRNEFYNNGVDVTYVRRKRNGSVISSKTM